MDGQTMMTLQDTVRVMIADDNFDMRLLVRATLGSDARVDVVAEADDGPSAVEASRQAQPDVCVLDYRMPGLTGIEAASQILAERPETKILLFSAYLTPEITDAADELGLRCLRKDLFMDLPATVVDLAEGR
jgi:DNA-binding NarL/FixJ family response regulator